MKAITKIFNFLLYSNLWIALSSITMTAKTIFLVGENPVSLLPVYGFVFCSTLFIYAGHRVIGIRKSEAFKEKGRYKIINEYKYHIILYAILGAVGTLGFSFFLAWKTLLSMLLPGLISLAYILPAFSGKEKKRLRDFDFVKIFFVALVWMWVAVILPILELGSGMGLSFIILSSLEVFLFVFAITLPFDIRDLKQDGHNDVKTIPGIWGEEKSIRLALALLAISLLLAILNITVNPLDGTDGMILLGGYMSGYAVTAWLISHSTQKKKDWYYTFLLDGTMILIPLLIMGFPYLFEIFL